MVTIVIVCVEVNGGNLKSQVRVENQIRGGLVNSKMIRGERETKKTRTKQLLRETGILVPFLDSPQPNNP